LQFGQHLALELIEFARPESSPPAETDLDQFSRRLRPVARLAWKFIRSPVTFQAGELVIDLLAGHIRRYRGPSIARCQLGSDHLPVQCFSSRPKRNAHRHV